MAPPTLVTRLPGTALVSRLEVLPDLAGRLVADTGPLAALSASLHLPFYREVRVLASYQTLRHHPIWQNPALDVGGLPVVLVGGLASSPRVLAPMLDWLQRIGCRTLLAPTQYGVACGQRTAVAVEDALARHVDATGGRAGGDHRAQPRRSVRPPCRRTPTRARPGPHHAGEPAHPVARRAPARPARGPRTRCRRVARHSGPAACGAAAAVHCATTSQARFPTRCPS